MNATTSKRISIITDTFAPDVNGVAHTLSHLVNGLLDRGYHVDIICPDHEQREDAELRAQLTIFPVKGFRIPQYPDLRFGVATIKQICSFWQDRRPDAVYIATEGILGWAALHASKQYEVPVVSGFHTNFHTYSKHYGLEWLSKLVFKYLRYFHNNTRCTLVPTTELKMALNEMGIKPLSVLGRGVDTRLFSPQKRCDELRADWRVDDSDLVAIYVGRIAAEKNIDLVMKTFFKLREGGHCTKLVLVGDGPYLKKCGLDHDDVVHCGVQRGEELARHYASADVFLFASQTETYGNVIAEAMASGLGVVAYNEAAASLLIESEINGVLSHNREEYGFIESAHSLVNCRNRLVNIRNQARKRAEHLSWDRIVNQFELVLFQS